MPAHLQQEWADFLNMKHINVETARPEISDELRAWILNRRRKTMPGTTPITSPNQRP